MPSRIASQRILMAITAATVVTLAGCGGSSATAPTAPTPPSNPTPSPIAGGPCSAVVVTSGDRPAIVNGTDCSATAALSSVVWLQLLGSDGRANAFCSGTIIDNQWVLTAAHCLGSDTKGVAAWLAVVGGVPIIATEFHASPLYTGIGPAAIDVGVVKFPDLLGRAPVPLLTSREPVVGETGVISGWGDGVINLNAPNVLRAGSVTVSQVLDASLQTAYSPSASNVCYGDSGGPLLLSQGGVWAVAGIISSTTSGCLSGSSSFAKIRNSAIRDFIVSYVPTVGQR